MVVRFVVKDRGNGVYRIDELRVGGDVPDGIPYECSLGTLQAVIRALGLEVPVSGWRSVAVGRGPDAEIVVFR